ncbi:MAG: protein kinase [Planctomycetaceae bacterium]|nr:protein kinase [Planctomycetaceae bacterium]
MGADELLEHLVFEALEALENEGPYGLERLIAAHPQRAAELRLRMEALARAGLVGSASERLPESIGDFQILASLGRGGMGVVYLARQVSLQRTVALKLIRPEQLYFPGARERFQREVSAVARLSHPGIVAIHSVGEERSIPYFAMEAVEGASLADVLRELSGRAVKGLSGRDLFDALVVCMAKRGAKVPDFPAVSAPCFEGSWPQVATRLTLAIAEALAHAHSRGVLHRDVKPANALLTPEGRLVLLDFGLASLSGSTRLTKTGTALGSVPYMSPEQVDGRVELDARSDVWSTGVTYYELLTLRLPFDGKSDLEVKSAIQAAHPSSPRQVHSGLSEDAEAVVLAALERDPARRYESAQALADDLRRVLELRPILARRPGWTREVRGFVRRRPTAAVAIGFGALLLVVGPLVFGAVQRGARVRVETANRAAERANLELAAALDDVRAERDRADGQRDLAERNFERALEAVDTMLRRTAEARLADMPRTATLRRELLEQALAFHTQLLADGQGDPRAREERARSLQRAGDLRLQLGELPEAIAALEEAVAELGAVASGSERADMLRVELARAHELLAVAWARSGKIADAARNFEAALATLDAIRAGRLSSPSLAQRWYGIAVQLCQARAELGEQADAAAELDRLAAEIDGAPPELRAELWSQEIDALLIRGVLAVRTGDVEAAEIAFERVRTRCNEAQAEHGDDPSLRRALASTLESQALLASQGRKWPLAATRLDAAVELFEQYVADEPDVPAWSSRLAALLGSRAANQRELDPDADTSADQDRSVAVLEALAARYPYEPAHLQRLGIAYGERAGSRRDDAAVRDAARAIDVLERALEQRPSNKQVLANLVVSLANGGNLARDLGEVELAVARYGRALELLEHASFGESERLEIEVRCGAGEVFALAGDVAGGRAQLERARDLALDWCERRPTERAAQNAAAVAGLALDTHLLLQGDLDGARETLSSTLPLGQRASEGGGRFPRDTLALVWLRLSETERRAGDLPAARRAFASAVEETGASKERFEPYPTLQALFDDPAIQGGGNGD